MESLPEGLSYQSSPLTQQSIADRWLQLLDEAERSVDIAAFYVTLRGSDTEAGASSNSQVGSSLLSLSKLVCKNPQKDPFPPQYLNKRMIPFVHGLFSQGRMIFDGLKKLESKGVKLQVAVNAPQTSAADTEELAAQGRSCSTVAGGGAGKSLINFPGQLAAIWVHRFPSSLLFNLNSSVCSFVFFWSRSRGRSAGGRPEGSDGRHRAHQAVGGGPEASLRGQRQHGLALPQSGRKKKKYEEKCMGARARLCRDQNTAQLTAT